MSMHWDQRALGAMSPEGYEARIKNEISPQTSLSAMRDRLEEIQQRLELTHSTIETFADRLTGDLPPQPAGEGNASGRVFVGGAIGDVMTRLDAIGSLLSQIERQTGRLNAVV